MTSEYRKEIAEAMYKALQQRKKQKIKAAKTKDNVALTLAIDSIKRHRGRDNRKYFF